jgi:hypothetical protein
MEKGLPSYNGTRRIQQAVLPARIGAGRQQPVCP